MGYTYSTVNTNGREKVPVESQHFFKPEKEQLASWKMIDSQIYNLTLTTYQVEHARHKNNILNHK